MSFAASNALRRLPFTRDDTDAIAAFCATNGGSREARLLLGLTSGAGGVFVIGDGADVALIATVVDRVSNGADAALLETLAVRTRIPAVDYIRLLVEPAVAFARAGERRALHVVLEETRSPAAGADEALRAAGFAHVYDSYEMRRPQAAPPPTAPDPLPVGWTWTALDERRADEAHAALTEMFRGALGASLMSLADFRAAVASGVPRWRVLLDGDLIAGLVRVASEGARGHLRILGRAPAYRGQGVGPRLVYEGLRVLRDDGVGEVDLTVEAANESALALYQRFSFEVVSKTPVFGLALR